VLDDLVSSPALRRLTVTVSVREPRPESTPARQPGTALHWAVFALLVAVGTVLRALSLAQTPVPGNREAALVTQVVELSRLGVQGTLSLGRLPVHLVSLATPQLAALTAAGGSWGRSPTALGAVREAGLPLWLATAVLTALLARRFGAGRGWALLAVGVLALCPAAVASAREVSPENVAVVWGLLALWLAAGPYRSGRAAVLTDLGAIACLTIGVLSAPVTFAVLPAVLLCTGRHGDGRRVALIGGAVLFLTGLGAAAALASAAPASVTSNVPGQRVSNWGQPWLGTGWLGIEIVTPLAALVVALLALRARGSRPLAVSALLVPLAAALLGASVTPLVVPLVAVLTALVVAARWGSWRRSWSPAGSAPAWRRVPPRVTAAALAGLAVAGVWTVGYARLPAALAPTPNAQAMDWMRANVPLGELVLTDRRTRVTLVAGTDDWNTVTTEDACRREALLLSSLRTAPNCGAATLWITDRAVSSGLPSHVDQVTGFGPLGRGHIDVLRELPHPHHQH
jgi:hypothetical protein